MTQKPYIEKKPDTSLMQPIDDTPDLTTESFCLLYATSDIDLMQPIERDSLYAKILLVYQQAKESVILSNDLLAQNELDDFLDQCEQKLETTNMKKSQLKKYRRAITNIRDINSDDIEVISSELAHLSQQFPDITRHSNFIKFALAFGVGLFNGVKSTFTKHGLTAYLAYQAAQSPDIDSRAIFGTLATINAISSNPPLPSISRILSYIDFTFFEEIFFRIYKRQSIKEIFNFKKEDFFTIPKMSLMLEGSGIFILIPMEILRMFELDELSIKTLRYWKNIRLLTNLFNNGGDGGN